MKLSKAQIVSRVHAIPDVQFERQQLTSFAGLVLLQVLFRALDLRRRLSMCFKAVRGAAYSTHVLFVQLVVHLFIGFRELRDREHYAHDPLVARVCGVRRLADVATLSRRLGGLSQREVDAVRRLGRDLVLDRVVSEALPRVTLDYDGSVLSTRRHAEGTAVGFNKTRKGARSYYPLFCTLAQTGQFLDFLHRPGNVHDSNGARDLILENITAVRERLPNAVIESRMDSAFFSEDLLGTMDDMSIEFSASVPFERFPQLKQEVIDATEWHRINDDWSYALSDWRPKSWERNFRFILFRRRSLVQRKGPLQLDLFVPRDYEFEYKVVVTNKEVGCPATLLFHNGRGSQEGLIGEGKTSCSFAYIPMRRRVGNQIFLAAGLFAHNLGRELQMRTKPRMHSRSTANRAALWAFEKLETMRHRMIQRAGRLTSPQGRLVLTMSASPSAEADISRALKILTAETN